MPTPVEVFAQLAAEYGGVDPHDAEAVQTWYVESVPTLSRERLEALLEGLLSHEADSTDRPVRPSYPRAAPIPGLETAPPVPLPRLAAGWLALYRKLVGTKPGGGPDHRPHPQLQAGLQVASAHYDM